MPALYLVATPIGNLEDISLRAIRILGEVKLIAAEDTRKTRRLLSAYGIKTPLTSYYEHSKSSKLSYIMEFLEHDDVALVSEAGVPGINDPGYELVSAAIERDVLIVAIPGASVIPVALVVSGLPTDQFVYVGFLPRKKGERKHMLTSIATERRTIIALESPHRLSASLADILEILGDRKISICRELTKIHEEVFRGTVNQAIAYFNQPRGEFTIVLAGCSPEERERQVTDVIKEKLRRLRNEGVPAKEAVSQIASETTLSKKLLYQSWLEL